MVSPRFLSQSVVDVGTWISPQQQRKGYGKKILTELFERLCVKGVEKVTYETEPKNKASIQLALSAGFILVEEGEEMRFQKSLLSD